MNARRSALITAALAAALTVAACASIGSSETPRAPQPLKPVDQASFYTGRWYEIARTPMKLTDGCVAGTTDFSLDAGGRLIDLDACRMGSPKGEVKSFGGPIDLLDATNAKFRVNYKVFGLFTAPRTYWVLDHGDDWFITADPKFETVALFTRAAQPGRDTVQMLTRRAAELGYDVSKLEYPEQFASAP